MLKLYVVVRNDIDVPFQMCQVAHAVANFATEHPDRFKDWNKGNNTICVLQARDEAHLRKLIEIAEDGHFKHTAFYDSDLSSIWRVNHYSQRITYDEDGPWLTAVAFAPDWFLQNVILADLPLALDNKTLMAKAGLSPNSVPVSTHRLSALKKSDAQLAALHRATPSERRRYFRTPTSNTGAR